MGNFCFFEMQRARQIFHDRELSVFGNGDMNFRRCDRRRKLCQQIFQIGIGGAEDFDQARGAVNAVIKTEPALLEKNVAGKFAAEQRAGFLHLGLDIGVAAFPQDRTTSVT